MPEGVHPYPRWQGRLRRGPAFPVIAAEEVRRAFANQWARTALTVAFAYAVVFLASMRGEDRFHTWENFLVLLDRLRWAGLAIAAVMAGPAFLEDKRRGALELYLSRAVTRADHVVGKVLAVSALTWIAVSGAALVYWVASFLVFEQHPERWAWAWAGILGYGLLWTLVVAGLGLGLSCVLRSSRAASIVLFGGVAAVDVVLAELLEAITRSESLEVLSPFSQLAQQTTWLFGVEAPYAFPWWWGAAALGGLAAVGWALVAWKHPRLPGVE